jgi:hypothetical protein
MIVAVLLLLAVYGYAYKTGIVDSLAAAFEVDNPGPLREPAGLHNADLSELKATGKTGTSPTAAKSLDALDGLPVAGRAPKTGYTRAQFGAPWSDVDHNGCDTRNDVLHRDLTTVVLTGGACVVATGTLADPYTARTIAFVRGKAPSSAVQIDHLVALSDAWQTGAQALSVTKRTALANDPRNLLAVDGPTNSAKGDSDAAGWLPPNKAFRCTYVARQVQVKDAYQLWVTPAERTAIADVLKGC